MPMGPSDREYISIVHDETMSIDRGAGLLVTDLLSSDGDHEVYIHRTTGDTLMRCACHGGENYERFLPNFNSYEAGPPTRRRATRRGG